MFADHRSARAARRKVAPSVFVGYERYEQGQDAGLARGEEELLEQAPAGWQAAGRRATPAYRRAAVKSATAVRCAAPPAAVRSSRIADGYWLHQPRWSKARSRRRRRRARVDEEARRATERNHTATHLLHRALKNVLGPHVAQAGSEVAPERLRFDYTHGEKLTDAQIEAIEDQVNQVVLAAIPVAARSPLERGARRLHRDVRREIRRPGAHARGG